MRHALAPDFRLRNFNTAFFADNAAMFQALVFTAEALVVLDRPENLGAEKTVAFRLEGPVIDRLRIASKSSTGFWYLKSFRRSFITLSPTQC
jgi:hypothetical protein